MIALKDTEIEEIIKTPQDTPQVTPQVEMLDRFTIDSRCYNSNKLANIWRLFGEYADHNWVTNWSYFASIFNKKILLQPNGIRMTLIGWIFTDTHFPCASVSSVSSVQSVFYRNSAIIDEDNKPQINADERRYLQITVFGKTTHRKGRKERKALQQESLRSLRFNVFCTPAHERVPPAVHRRMSMEGGRNMHMGSNEGICLFGGLKREV